MSYEYCIALEMSPSLCRNLGRRAAHTPLAERTTLCRSAWRDVVEVDARAVDQVVRDQRALLDHVNVLRLAVFRRNSPADFRIAARVD
jgi:hypothetical protein